MNTPLAMPNSPELHSRMLSLCQSFQTITLNEMKSIQLMNRIDTKFIATREQLNDILELAQSSYRIQVVNEERISSYDTLYFDTEDYDMYIQHHNRRLKRQKIRTRSYVQSAITFLEIKNKNNKGRTNKVRVPIGSDEFHEFGNNNKAMELMKSYSLYNKNEIMPRLRTQFNRITLVNIGMTERLTIDMDLAFHNMENGVVVSKPNLVIIELKQDGQVASPMRTILARLRIKQFKISKYCIGTVFTNESVKRNRFKTKMAKIQKLCQ